jgi:hypothetical protein
MALKFEGKFAIGDFIRAYDFQPMFGRGDSYLEGKVLDVHMVDPTRLGDYSYYLISVENKVFAGEKLDMRHESSSAKVPMEVSMCEYDHRIISL